MTEQAGSVCSVGEGRPRHGVGLSIISQQGGKSPSNPHNLHSKPCPFSPLITSRETIADAKQSRASDSSVDRLAKNRDRRRYAPSTKHGDITFCAAPQQTFPQFNRLFISSRTKLPSESGYGRQIKSQTARTNCSVTCCFVWV
jgi:hypothetical protein